MLSQEGLQSVVNTFRDAFLNIVHQPDVCVTAFPPELRDVVASPSPNVSVKRASQPISTISGRHRSTTEQTLCTVFSLVTNVPAQKIGLDTPLYALGLDSVAAIQVAARCRSEYGLELSVADIFVGETISGIATAYDLQALTPSTRKLSKVLVSDEERNRALNILGVDETLVESVLPVLAVSFLFTHKTSEDNMILRVNITILLRGSNREGHHTSPSLPTKSAHLST